MAELNIKTIGFKEFERAIRRHPEKTRERLQIFFSRAEAKLKHRIRNKPWRLGGSGGGAPVFTGNLRDGTIGAGRAPLAETKLRKKDGVGHVYERKSKSLRIFPTASYSKYVHEGTGRMESRPWLDYTLRKEKPNIKKLEKELLADLVKNLAK